MKKVWFAHPINTYGESLEKHLLVLLEHCWFPGYRIMNPNNRIFEKEYQKRKAEKHPHPFGFFEEEASKADVVAVLAFPDGQIGAGVFKELAAVINGGGRAWELFLDITRSPIEIDIENARMRTLSINDTRVRIRNPDGSIKQY